MHTIQPHQLRASEQLLFSYVQSLIKYAEQDASFAHNFWKIISTQNWANTPTTFSETPSRHIHPISQTDGYSIAHWVIQSLQTHPEYTTARGTLACWAQSYESPKNLILGIVGLAIIGPTLGIIASKKKKKRKAQLIIKDLYFQSLSKTQLATLSTQLSQAVIAKETRLAGGNVYNLHPDSAAWCIEEAVTTIYTDSERNLESLLKTVVSENLSHQVENDNNGNIQAIVIAPSVNDSLVEESDAKKI
jgi:thiamine phosphate synthase YjbQ (UPF0047 family)